MCIQLNNTWCVIFKVKSIHFCLIYCIKYNNIKVKFSYERKTRIKENDSVEHTNNDIKYYLELNLLIPCFQCHRCDYHSYIMITYRNRIRYLNHINKKMISLTMFFLTLQATSVQNSTLEEIAYSLFMKQTVANTSPHVHSDILHWLLINVGTNFFY